MASRIVIAVCTLALVLMGAAGAAVAGEDAEAMTAGELWKKNCASCHAADGSGDTKAGRKLKVRNLTDAEVKAAFDRERMIGTVRDGVANEAGKQVMKPYAEKLDEADIAKLVDYIIGGFGG